MEQVLPRHGILKLKVRKYFVGPLKLVNIY